MRLSSGVSALGVVCAAACSAAPSDPTATVPAAIQGGTSDTTHSFVVAVLQNSNQLSLCSGSLLAPNLVATARHCVTALTGSPQIDCATSTFGANLPTSDLIVTNDAKISPTGHFVRVSQIVAPTGVQQTKVCGNDLALLILAGNIPLAQYVTPTINPPMTDPQYSISVTAIGYGVATPTDVSGSTAGVRRIRQNVGLSCVPDDTSFTGCYTGTQATQVLSPNEFVSGDASTCEGDSGSGAFDQGSFNRGAWVSFGVLSRGAVDPDGGTCIQPIYSRFDAWAQLLSDTARRAASIGGYPVPKWAAAFAGPGDAGGAPDGPSLGADGVACNSDGQCQSQACVSTDNVSFTCASSCKAGACSVGFSCARSFCFPSTSKAAAAQPGGCSATRWGVASGTAPWRSLALGLGALLSLCAARRRGRPPEPGASRRRRSSVGFQTRQAADAQPSRNTGHTCKPWGMRREDPPGGHAGARARDLLKLV